MEPCYTGEKFLAGYARTCPLCKRLVITELSTMRIKRVIDEKKKKVYHFCVAIPARICFIMRRK